MAASSNGNYCNNGVKEERKHTNFMFKLTSQEILYLYLVSLLHLFESLSVLEFC